MKMKKVFSACALLLALTVVACSGGSKEPAKSSSSNAPASTTSQQQKIKITAADNKKEIEIAGTVNLTADVEGVTWETSDAKIATVNNGVVTGVAAGSATITAKKEGYKNGTITITVKKPAAPHLAEPTWPETCPALIDTTSWTAGTAAKNSYGKDYTPLTAADGSVGVKIAMTDYNPEGASFDESGKLPTEADAYVKFNVKAPKAGVYQLILKASCSESGDSYQFAGESSRGFDVLVNEYDDQDNVYGSRLYSDAGLDHDEKRAFVFALVQLNGPTYEDEIAFRNPYYRMKFDTSVDLILAENK